MRHTIQIFFFGLAGLFLFGSVSGCSSIPVLRVHYQLPAPSERLEGQQIVYSFKDSRESKDIIGEGAKEEFKNFSGNISFSIARHKDRGFKIGPLDVPALFRKAFKNRLENEGLTVLFDESLERPRLLVELKDFRLDLKGRKWVAQISYEAKLFKEGKVVSIRRIGGQVERFGLWGEEAASEAMGEIFTSLVNRLDVYGMFKEADLV